MRRLTSLIISMLFAASGWAQSGMTDNQVVDFVIEQNTYDEKDKEFTAFDDAADNLVNVSGKVKRPMWYEMMASTGTSIGMMAATIANLLKK